MNGSIVMGFVPPFQVPNMPKSDGIQSVNDESENPHILKYTEKYKKSKTSEIETLEQRKLAMKKVLLHIQEKKPFEELSFEERRIFKECYDLKYFEGVVPCEMISGRIVAEYRHDPRLTLKGIEFLDSFNSTDKGKDATANNDKKGNSAIKKCLDVIKAFVKRFWKLFCGIGVIVSVFGWPLIKRFFAFLSSIF